jgi:hypothetical protein
MKSQEESAVLERINRRYERDKIPDRWLKVHKARGAKNIQELGEYFTREVYHGTPHEHHVDMHHVDIYALAKKLGV